MAYTVIDQTPERPKVSVIMLAYNNEAFIRTGISSILRQEAPFDIQLVLSDDCSTDSTADICRDYAERFPGKVTLVAHDSNVGIPRNFLDAHKACKGEYIAMCDGDDYWCNPRKLAIMVEFMDANPDYSLAFHKVINSYEHNHTKSFSNGAQKSSDYTLADLCRGNFITNCSSLFRRSCCPTPPEWINDVLLCDYIMHLINAMHGKIRYFNRSWAVYRKHRKALWTGVKETQRLRDAIFVREKALQLLKGSNRAEYDIMAGNYTTNALAYIVAAEACNEDSSAIKSRLMELHPDWTAPNLENAIAARRLVKAKPGMTRRIASTARAVVSRFIPLPKVKML